ncbi:hypothetical protein RT21_19550 [Pseudomonas sp. 10B238]|nr:hypothetical protein RT21_19550 [Pseudomonas sp. 10B238]
MHCFLNLNLTKAMCSQSITITMPMTMFSRAQIFSALHTYSYYSIGVQPLKILQSLRATKIICKRIGVPLSAWRIYTLILQVFSPCQRKLISLLWRKKMNFKKTSFIF